MASVSRGISVFRPTDDDLSEEVKSEIQMHRVMTVLGLVLVPVFGVLYGLSSPDATDPMWARLGLAAMFAALLGASYRSDWVRNNYVVLLRGIMYLLLIWFAVVTALNQFRGDYAIGLLLVYAVLIAVVGVGVESILPVLQFAGFGILCTVGALALGRSPESSPVILLACMFTVALIGGVAIAAHLSARRTVREREDRLRGLANSIPGVIFQLHRRSDNGYRMQFVSKRAEAVLNLSPHPVGFFERFVNRIPTARRQGISDALEEAVANESSWRVEVPFENQTGDTLWLLVAATPERQTGRLVFNGVILDITERQKARRALADRQKKMESLYTATTLLLSANSRDAVAARTSAVLHDVFDFPMGNVGLREDGRVIPKGRTGSDGSEAAKWFGPEDGENIVVRACETGETVIVDLGEESSASRTLHGIDSVAAVPIGTHGAIVVGQDRESRFDEFDLRLLEVLASYVTVVLDGLNGRSSE